MSPAKVDASNIDNEISSDMELANEDHKRNLSISVMLSKPLLALEFNCLEMNVEAPTIVPQEKQE